MTTVKGSEVPTSRWFVTGWRSALLAALVFAGAALSVAGANGASRTGHRVSATIFVDPSVVKASTTSSDPAAQRAALDAYIATAQSDSVLQAAARAGGISVGALSKGLTVAAIGATNAVSIQFESAGRVDPAVVQVLASQALNAYARSGIGQLEKDVALYQSSYDQSSRALLDYERATNEVAPDAHYQAAIQAQLQGGGPANLTALLRRLQAVLPKYRELVAAQTRAGNILQTAQARLLDLRAVLAQSMDASNITVSPVERLSRIQTYARFGALGALAGLLLGGCVLVAVTLVRTRPDELAAPVPVPGSDQSPPLPLVAVPATHVTSETLETQPPAAGKVQEPAAEPLPGASTLEKLGNESQDAVEPQQWSS